MKCTVLSIGTEVVSGDIINTNAPYIANFLKKFGVKTISHIAILDDEKTIIKAVQKSLKKASIIITTGGLGPTYDDITKVAIAKALNLELIFDQKSMTVLEGYFAKLGKSMCKNNEQQCFFPKGSMIIKNNNGTAPASITKTKKGTVIMLPGPPNELIPLLESEEIMDFLDGNKKLEIVETTLKLIGIGESPLEEKLKDLMNYKKDLILAPYAKTGEVELKITAMGETYEIAKRKETDLKDKIYSLVGDYIYSDDGKSLEEVLLAKLKENNLKLITVESCTGGLIAKKITEISGSSENFLGGLVTYSNELKMALCDVGKSTLDEFGAVSKGVACEMAEGARLKYNADIAISVTGIAGPNGGTEEKPIGLCYIGYSTTGKTDAIRYNFMGNREKVREQASKNAVYLGICNINS